MEAILAMEDEKEETGTGEQTKLKEFSRSSGRCEGPRVWSEKDQTFCFSDLLTGQCREFPWETS